MKKTVITLFIIGLTLNAFGQQEERKNRIEALKVGFITEKLELTPKEAQLFWPVYYETERKRETLREAARKIHEGTDLENLTNAEANILITDMLAIENKKHELQTEQVNNLLKVIPAKKVILLRAVEEQFNRRMLQEMKKRHNRLKQN